MKPKQAKKRVRKYKVFIPLGDAVLINPVPVETISPSGLITSGRDKSYQKGVVTKVGPGLPGSPKTIREKDMVLFPKGTGVPLKLNNHDYIVIKQHQIICKL